MLYCWKTFHTNFPLCCSYASSFLDQRPHLLLLFYFLTLLWRHPSIWLCFHFCLWQLCCWNGGDRERPVMRVVLSATPSCQGCSQGGNQGVTNCRATARQQRAIQSWKGTIRMQSLDLLGSGTAFGVTLCKKDELHFSQAWLAVVILVALYFSKAYMHFFSQLEKPLCMEDFKNLSDTSQEVEIMKLL